MEPVLTSSLLESYLRCHFKSYLQLQGRIGETTAYSHLQAQLDAHHRTETFEWLVANAKPGFRWLNGSRISDLATGDSMILDAVGSAEGLQTHFHGLQRVPGASAPDAYYYQPFRISRYMQPHSAARLLLVFDALVLSHLQGFFPEHGVLICGPKFKQIRVRLRANLDSLMTVLADLRLQAVSGNKPLLALNAHCDVCEFKQLCRTSAEETDNLSLLRGMTAREMASHNSRGIFTVNQLSYTFRSRRIGKRLTQRFLHSFALQARALRENTLHVHGDPCLTLPPSQVYLDIEGLPDQEFYYLIGALVVRGELAEYHCFWADDEGQELGIFTQLAELLIATNDSHVFHYGNYDVKAIRRMLPRLPASLQEPLTVILANSTNILSIVSSHVYFPTRSQNLKEVASILGFRWSSNEASGLQSIVWRKQWEDARDEMIKTKLLEYNQDDCLALRVLTEFIALIKNREVLAEAQHALPNKVVFTSDLVSSSNNRHRFGKIQFCLPDFELVNKCAYYDYQRDRAYIRGRRPRSQTKPRSTSGRARPLKVDKRIELQCKRCPHCNSRRLSEGRTVSTRTIDIRFTVSGVKKWVTKYSSRHYQCHKCGSSFKPREYPESISSYGNGLIAWVIYQNVALGLNMSKIRQSLREVFKLNVPQPTLHRFKGSVARRYEPTKEAILAQLLREPSLCVDETEARLRDKKAHVWVFAGIGGAYYEYRDSRNGQFLVERLSGFGGVLVSDFFTAYDSIECPQQKCLIHLIRDMNEDMRINPFDVELREIVQAFALVVRPIIETVDRYGLTKDRLQKHKNAAMGFVEKVVGNRVLSAAARKYRNRIEKYSDRLFTFLDYDCVPWNNNNAEHAIKAFARYRRFADGRFTKQSVEDYLIILSVMQTCRYQGKEFLNVLLNNETRFASPQSYQVPAVQE